MPRGYRCIFIALVGIALAGAGPPNQPDQNSNAADNQTNAAAATYKPDANRYSEDCYKNPDHEAADLCAQWSAADATKETAGLAYWGNWIAGVGAVLSFFSILLVLWALKQGRDANRISAREYGRSRVEAKTAAGEARRALEVAERSANAAAAAVEQAKEASDLELRPWLSISVKLASAVTIDERGLTLSADIIVTNVGKSVAQQVWITPKAVALADACAADAFFAECREKDIRKGLNNLLVPNEHTSGRHFLLVTPEELDKVFPPGTVMPGIYVSAVYMTLRGDCVLQTGRSFTLTKAGPGGGRTFERAFGETPQHLAGIHEYPLGGDYVA